MKSGAGIIAHVQKELFGMFLSWSLHPHEFYRHRLGRLEPIPELLIGPIWLCNCCVAMTGILGVPETLSKSMTHHSCNEGGRDSTANMGTGQPWQPWSAILPRTTFIGQVVCSLGFDPELTVS